MEYCCLNHQRHGTCYFEFQRGKFCNSHWSDDSLYLHAELFDMLDLRFNEVLENFNYYGPTEVSPGEWEQLKSLANDKDDRTRRIIGELDLWVAECFAHENCFTILGI